MLIGLTLVAPRMFQQVKTFGTGEEMALLLGL